MIRILYKQLQPLVVLLVILALQTACFGAVVADPLPAIYKHSAVYSLQADGVNIPVIQFGSDYDYACFAASGPCSIQIDCLDAKEVKQATVSPIQFGLKTTLRQNQIFFKLDQPRYLIVTISDRKRLVITVDPPEANAPLVSDPNTANVINAGADPTGVKDSTAAIQQTIDKVSAAGQGTVLVPAGVYAIRNLYLKSNLSVYLAAGSVLVATGDPSEFTVQFRKKSLLRDGTWLISTADNAHDIKISGRGTIDGNGRRYAGKKLNFLISLLVPMHCQNVEVQGVTLRDSGLWGTVIARSEHINIHDTKHFNAFSIGEDDGIDICESNKVTIKHAIAISLDDPFSVKTWDQKSDIAKHWYGQARSAHDVVIEDCLAWTDCFAYKIGAGFMQPQSDILVHNCVAYDCAHGIGISHSYGSAPLTNVTFDGIDIEKAGNKCLGQSWGLFFMEHEGGIISHIDIKNCIVRDKGSMPFTIKGLSDDKIFRNISFENVKMPDRQVARSTEDLGLETTFTEQITVTP